MEVLQLLVLFKVMVVLAVIADGIVECDLCVYCVVVDDVAAVWRDWGIDAVTPWKGKEVNMLTILIIFQYLHSHG